MAPSPDLSFETFAVGDRNAAAVEAARPVARTIRRA